MNRIFYLCPDIARPTGGIRRIYRHVEILNEHGYRAYVVHSAPDFKIDWFSTNVPVKYLKGEGVGLNRSDVLVIPETCFDAIMNPGDTQYQRVVMALNWAYVYLGLPPGKDYRQGGIKDVICGSEYIREFIAKTMGIEGHVVRLGIDTDLFVAGAEKKKQIACMPRKNANDLHNIQCCFRSRFPEFGDVPFVPINDAKLEKVAELLGESAVFLATGYPEGFSRPPLEAMACECIVVGFAGRGALEYMHNCQNCFVADDGDILTAAEHLGAALSLLGSEEAKRMQALGRKTALFYSFAEEEKSVIEYWKKFLGQAAVPESNRISA